ncbi:MAG TPA: hypothetical protein VGV59_09580 [Pyrinomonadaceae bacterium]|nr:hypothetical protein [Pyrinomonadaceae bacterium]
MRQEDFARFLECLSPDPQEAGLRYIRLHKKYIGFFSMKGVSDPESAADETIERAAVKINAGTQVTDVEAFCTGIARNVARERWRREQREGSTFTLFVENLANNSDEEIERIQLILKPCFAQLSDEEQELLRRYCQVLHGRARAEHRRQMADEMKTTVLALRMRVTRLRSTLTDCVRKRSGEV